MSLLSTFCFSQTNNYQLNYSKTDIHQPKEVEESPSALVMALTKNKNGDKEKFDAIFAWVASNISYNYQQYFSSDGSVESNVKRILKNKSGICLDYAALMDSLCALAGLTNVTVYGYVRDNISDVNDSLFFDNHAWNAVKLDGDWFVYDVTFASGKEKRDWTKFSKRILKWRDKYPAKYKRKRYRIRKRFFAFDECNGLQVTKSPAYYYKQKLSNRMIRFLIGLFPLKIKREFINEIIEEYYLCEPDKFLITHLPDDPCWALTSNVTRNTYEKDSAYYFFNETTLKTQNRVGVSCPSCDTYVSSDDFTKTKTLREETKRLNNRNFFMPSYCEYKIALHYNNQAELANDSLTKVSLLDSSMLYYSLMKQNIRKAYKTVDEEFVLQTAKNRKKQRLALDNTSSTVFFIRNRVNITMQQQRKVTEVYNKARANKNKYNRNREQIDRLKEDITPIVKSKVNDKIKQQIQADITDLKSKIDYLTQSIETQRLKADSVLTNLALNVWQKVLYNDTLTIPIANRTRLRYLLRDNYKKDIVDINQQMDEVKRTYAINIDNTVYTPSQAFNDICNQLFLDMDKRYGLQKTLFHSTILAVKYGMENPTQLTTLKIEWETQQKEMSCWLVYNFPQLKATQSGFEGLREKQRTILHLLNTENEVERYRTHEIAKELLRRKKKYRHIAVNNSSVARINLSKVKKIKREYLNYLKRERKKKK